jgi:hypothetical protein
MSSKKVACALDAASGNRPVVILANLSGFDGSPESPALQLEHGAEIARAIVTFDGPIFSTSRATTAARTSCSRSRSIHGCGDGAHWSYASGRREGRGSRGVFAEVRAYR